jgi:DNA polymerase-3 subunit epsilon
LTETVIVLDFETTGLSPKQGARPTEVAAVVLEDNLIVDRFSSLMNPGVPIPRHIQNLTGITNRMVRSAPSVSTVMEKFARFIRNVPLIAHNASFDKQFLDWEFDRLGLKRKQSMICSMLLARRVYPSSPNHKLGTLVDFVNLQMTGRYHRAEADAEITAKLWVEMKNEIKRCCRIDSVPIDLMEHIQKVPCRSMKRHVDRYFRVRS